MEEEEKKVEQPEEEEHFDYKKAREDRIVRNTEKRILKDLGVESFDYVKEKLKQNEDMFKELETQRDNGIKLSVYSAGFDDQFVDFVAHEIKKIKKDDEKIEDVLDKYKKKHSQFLRSTKVQVNSSPDFETKHRTGSSHSMMNDFIRGKI